MLTDLEQAIARAEHAERKLREQSQTMAVLRGAARKAVCECPSCRGTGVISKQRGFYTTRVECHDCLPLRVALESGEIV